MKGLTRIAKLSPLAKREAASHRRALSAPMTKIPMASDPHLERIDQLAGSAAMLERRACQYAAWLAVRDHVAAADMRCYNARYDGAGEVYFAAYGRAPDFAVRIPEHVLRFDLDAAPLMIEGPAEAAPKPQRCPETANLDLAAPIVPPEPIVLPAPRQDMPDDDARMDDDGAPPRGYRRPISGESDKIAAPRAATRARRPRAALSL
jgi:hypothetical protein